MWQNRGDFQKLIEIRLDICSILWYVFVLQEATYMNELLKELYIHFYEKRPVPQLKAEIEQCHQELI